jgi:hypothetical protein
MAPSLTRFARLALVFGLFGAGAAPFGVYARGNVAASHTHAAKQSTAVLVWQGKILPIVTDVYASVSDLSVAVQNNDFDTIAKTGDQFAGERQRFDLVKPIPHPVGNAAKVLDRGLKDLSSGTKALVVGLRDSDSAGSRRAADQVENGLKLFNQGVGQIRRLNGPLGEPTIIRDPNAGPVPTPVVKGLP